MSEKRECAECKPGIKCDDPMVNLPKSVMFALQAKAAMCDELVPVLEGCLGWMEPREIEVDEHTSFKNEVPMHQALEVWKRARALANGEGGG